MNKYSITMISYVGNERVEAQGRVESDESVIGVCTVRMSISLCCWYTVVETWYLSPLCVKWCLVVYIMFMDGLLCFTSRRNKVVFWLLGKLKLSYRKNNYRILNTTYKILNEGDFLISATLAAEGLVSSITTVWDERWLCLSEQQEQVQWLINLKQ